MITPLPVMRQHIMAEAKQLPSWLRSKREKQEDQGPKISFKSTPSMT
jgi:hypothetical protein